MNSHASLASVVLAWVRQHGAMEVDEEAAEAAQAGEDVLFVTCRDGVVRVETLPEQEALGREWRYRGYPA